MHFADTLTLDAPKRTKDGFLAVRAKAARSGVYDYSALEVGGLERGFKAGDTVKVYRPADEVFAPDSVASFLAKPVTNDHPSVPVTADNWKQHARGVNMGALRDGEYLAFDLVLMDSALIADVDSGKRELSNGYSCELVWGDGVAPDGQAYDAIQRNIRGNHIAVVDKGRAGPDCKIGDAAKENPSGGKRFADCSANPSAISGISIGDTKMKIMLDGLLVDLTDADAVKAAFDKKDAALADSAKALTDAKAALETANGEKAALEKQLADAKAANEPAAIDKLVADRAAFVTTAKALKADIVTDGKTNAEIRKEIVTAALGDAAPASDEAIAGAFAVLAKDAKPAADNVTPIGAAKTVADGANVVNTIRNARYA